MKQLDLKHRYPDLSVGPTLIRFMDDLTTAERFHPMLVMIRGHVMVAHMGRVGDASSGTRMVHPTEHPRAMSLVIMAWSVFEQNQ